MGWRQIHGTGLHSRTFPARVPVLLHQQNYSFMLNLWEWEADRSEGSGVGRRAVGRGLLEKEVEVQRSSGKCREHSLNVGCLFLCLTDHLCG